MMTPRDNNIKNSVWLNFASFATKVYNFSAILTCIICIGLYRSVQKFFLFLGWLVKSPFVFLETTLEILYLLDLKLSEGLIRFIGFVTPRSEFLTIILYLILSAPISVLKVFAYAIFFVLRALSFFPWFLQVVTFAIFVPPLVLTYDAFSFVIYHTKVLYYTVLGWFYKALKTFIRSYLNLLELRSLRGGMVRGGSRPTILGLVKTLSILNKRFRFEQFGNISSSKVVNYYNNSGTFDLDKYFLGHIPFTVYFNGRYEHEGGGLSSGHRLIHNARFFYQSVNKRKSLRLDYSSVKSAANLEEPIYNSLRVFEYHRYISMGLVHNFDFSSFPEYYRAKLFSRLLRFNLIPAVNFYYNIFNSTLRNRSKNPDFWTHYRRVVTNPNRGLTWFEYSRNDLLKDPIFSYNNYDYSSPRFGYRITSKLFDRRGFREILVSEGLRSSFDDYRSVTDVSGRAFTGGHFSQFVDDYDHYLKTKVHYKSKMERFWFKRVLLPDSGLASDRHYGLPSLLSDGSNSEMYKKQPRAFLKIVSVGFFGGIAALYSLLGKLFSIFYRFFAYLLTELRRVLGDFLFRAYLSLLFFVLRLPSLVARGKQGLAPVYEFFTYPVKVTPFSFFWTFIVFAVSLSRFLVSTFNWFYGLTRRLFLRIYGLITLPTDFIKFLLVHAKRGDLGPLVDNELRAIYKEVDGFIGWLLNDSDK